MHTAALETTGVESPVLTGGIRPSDAVVGRAESAGVPLLFVRTDTRMTINRTEDVIRSGRTSDADTVERMGKLLVDYGDVDAELPPTADG